MAVTIINKLKNLFSSALATVIIISLAILSRIIQLIYFFNIVVDASYQVIGTQSLLAGHGISLPGVLSDDLSTTIYTPLINWPPGYSVLMAPFYYLFNYNYIAAGITLDIVSAIGLIFICRAILKVLSTPLYLRNVFTLLTGFFIYFFYFNACSDAIAITLLLIALYFALVLLKTKRNLFRNTICFTFLLFSCASIKYLFMPTVLVIPLFLFIKGYTDGDTPIKKAGLYSFIILIALLASLLFYQKTIAGSATYISATGRGYFPENLLGAYPTFPASFLKPDTISLLPGNKAAIEKLVYNTYQGIYIIALVLLFIAFFRRLIRYRFKNLTLVQSFFYLSFFLSISVVILLAALSVFVEKEIHPTFLWTYIEEARYHGLPNVLMHLSVFALYQFYSSNRSVVLKYTLYFLFLLMVPEMLRGAYFNINRIQNFKKEEYSWQYENRLQQYAALVIQKEKQNNPIEKVVVTGTSYYMNHRVIINSHVPPLADLAKINDLSALNTRSPVLLLAILEKNALPSFKSFLSRKEVKAAGSYENFNFYTVSVMPH